MPATQLFIEDFESIGNGNQIYRDNSGFTSVVYNGSGLTTTGNAGLVANTSASAQGSTLGARYTCVNAASSANYFQYTWSGGTGDYFYFEWTFTMPSAGNPTTAQYMGWTPRFSTTENIRPRIGTDGKFTFFNTAGGTMAAFTATNAFVAGNKYIIKYWVKKGTTTTDGAAGVRILNHADGTVFHTATATNINTATSDPTTARFLMPATGIGWSTVDFDTLRIGRSTIADDWMSTYTVVSPPSITAGVHGPYYLVVAEDSSDVTVTWTIDEDTTATGKVPLTVVGGIALPSTLEHKVWAIPADVYPADWVVEGTDAIDQSDSQPVDTDGLNIGGGGPLIPQTAPPGNTWG